MFFLLACICSYVGVQMVTYVTLILCLLLLVLELSQRGRGLSEGADRAVLITGCDSGFGHQLAKTLDSMGFIVFAGCLHSDSHGAQTLAKEGSPRLNVLQLDVTRDEDLRKAKAFVEANLPEKGIPSMSLYKNTPCVFQLILCSPTC